MPGHLLLRERPVEACAWGPQVGPGTHEPRKAHTNARVCACPLVGATGFSGGERAQTRVAC